MTRIEEISQDDVFEDISQNLDRVSAVRMLQKINELVRAVNEIWEVLPKRNEQDNNGDGICIHDYGNTILTSIPPKQRCVKCGNIKILGNYAGTPSHLQNSGETPQHLRTTTLPVSPRGGNDEGI